MAGLSYPSLKFFLKYRYFPPRTYQALLGCSEAVGGLCTLGEDIQFLGVNSYIPVLSICRACCNARALSTWCGGSALKGIRGRGGGPPGSDIMSSASLLFRGEAGSTTWGGRVV